MNSESRKTKLAIISAGEIAIKELIAVAKEAILTGDETDISADRLKNAAATKKLAIFDALEILARIEEERNMLDENFEVKTVSRGGFAEKRGK
jgi:hypothetical protein